MMKEKRMQLPGENDADHKVRVRNLNKKAGYERVRTQKFADS
jgi:hypothetical protein